MTALVLVKYVCPLGCPRTVGASPNAAVHHPCPKAPLSRKLVRFVKASA